MVLGEILDIIIIALLAGMLLLQITGQRKTDLSKITALLKRTSEDQRDSVQKQIASGATEQFERFGVIQKSIQDTLLANRSEINQYTRSTRPRRPGRSSQGWYAQSEWSRFLLQSIPSSAASGIDRQIRLSQGRASGFWRSLP